MKKIDTLVQDIKDRITSNEPYDTGVVADFGASLAKLLGERLSNQTHTPSLRLSNLGTPCDRKLWYSVNKPELGERLSASTRLKFLFGDIIEHLVLFLARASGHAVSSEQKEVDLHGVRGHIDAVIDGELVDVKSASTFSFKKFRDHGLVGDDPFGYRHQLNGYLSSDLGSDPEVDTSRGHFLAVDKTLGNICLDTHDKEDVNYEEMVESKRQMLAYPAPPARGYSDVPDGRSGNRRLGMECSYCPFKQECWPGLRVFAYRGTRPVFLTRVSREPNVPEMKLNEVTED